MIFPGPSQLTADAGITTMMKEYMEKMGAMFNGLHLSPKYHNDQAI
jgi:hypothetical protein